MKTNLLLFSSVFLVAIFSALLIAKISALLVTDYILNSGNIARNIKGWIFTHIAFLPAGRQDDKSYSHDYRNTPD